MKKLTCLLSFVFFFIAACDNGSGKIAESAAEINNNTAYFFYSESCPHCHDALAYINKSYPGLNMEKVNVAYPGGYHLFVKCAEKFDLGPNIGTPLFCLGEHYIMGWSEQYQHQFDQYIQPFVK